MKHLCARYAKFVRHDKIDMMLNQVLDAKEKQKIGSVLRVLSCQAVQQANSGHPGMPLGFADAMVALLLELSFDASDPNWMNRDRLAFSCGHGCALWYSVLYGLGILGKQDLDNFRKLGSATPGHPETHIQNGAKIENGIDVTTGPLGMGFAWAVGMALAERILNAKHGDVVNHYTYIVCSDGDLMEGVSYEAAALAGQYQLGKIIALWDDNAITIDGTTDLSRNEDIPARFRAQQWDVQEVDGHNIEAIQLAIHQAKQSVLPSLIVCKTKIGRYSNLEGSNKAHGSPLGDVNLQALRVALDYNEARDIPLFFEMFEKIKANMICEKKEWIEKYSACELVNSFSMPLCLRLSDELSEQLSNPYATRKHSENILEQLIKDNENLIIASADLATSCGTLPPSGRFITKENYDGNLLACGIRENAMVAITGGMILHGGLHAVASTFLTFYDYARPAVRLAALMNVPLIMVATHDSVALGEDGPTHQPIEHLDSLRCMPNLLVARPADGFETFYCYQQILSSAKPAVLVLTRQALPKIYEKPLQEADLQPHDNSEDIIISCGSELGLVKDVGEQLKMQVISVPIWDAATLHALAAKLQYKKIWIVEASTAMCWRYFFPSARIFNVGAYASGEFGFGISGSQKDVLQYFGFTLEKLKKMLTE